MNNYYCYCYYSLLLQLCNERKIMKFANFEIWICRSGGAVSSGFRSFLENANNSAQYLFLRLWSCCAIREMKRWQWEEQRSGIRFITGGWLQCPRFQWGITGREVGMGGWGHARGGPDANSFCLKSWSEGFRTYFSFSRKSLFILSHLSGLQR